MIEFLTDFPCGNGKLVSYEPLEGSEKVAFLAEAKYREAQPLWFYFRINGLKSGRTVFKIANGHQFLSDSDVHAMSGDYPVYRAPGRSWNRTSNCSCVISPDGMPEVTFEIENCPEEVEVAFCYPYSPDTLRETMGSLDGFTEAVIGYSTKGRPISRYCTDEGRKTSKPGVYITCRQHAGETGASWVLDGMLRYLGSAEGTTDRERLNWWVVPMVDIDGVVEGCYGKDQLGGDMNRSWRRSFTPRTEVSAVIQDVERWQERCDKFVYFDMHCPANEVLGMQINIDSATDRKHQLFTERYLDKINLELEGTGLEPFVPNHFVEGTAASSQGNLNKSYQYFENIIGIPAIMFEISYQGPRSGGTYTIEDYRAYGSCLAKAIVRHLEQDD